MVALFVISLLASCTPLKNASGDTSGSTRSKKIDDSRASTDHAGTGGGSGAPIMAGDTANAAGGGGSTNTPPNSSSGGSGGAGSASTANAQSGRGGTGAAGEGSPTPAAAGSGGNAATIEEPPRDTTPLDPNVSAIDTEVADADSLRALSDWSRLPVFGSGRYEQQTSRDRGREETGAASLLPVIAYGNRDLNNFVCKSGNADTGPGAIIPYAYDAMGCSDSYVRGVVLARYEGSGRMTRLWLTSDALYLSGGTLSDEVLRIYVDDNPRAMVQLPLDEVLTGSAGEVFTIPFGVVSRNNVAWHYPIAFSRKLVVAIDRLRDQYYFQVDAVLDAQSQRRVAPRARQAQRDTARSLLSSASPAPASAASLRAETFALGAAEQREVQLSGAATIEDLRLRVAKDKLASLAGVRVSVTWDAAATPAIDVPLLDVFAASQSAAISSNLALASSTEGNDQLLSLRLPMPFRTSAAFVLKNAGSSAVNFQLEWLGEKRVPDAEFGHLYLQRNQAQLPAAQLEQPVAQASGRGRFVGVCGDLGGHQDRALTGVSTNLDLLQGDFRATADGKRVLDSTGTEDYVDSAFYFRESPKATPFAQNWGRVDDASAKPPGRISFCRWQVLGNEIDFQKDLKVIREISQYDRSLVELHRTVAYLYLP